MTTPTAVPYLLGDDGIIPNNPDLPVLVYPEVFKHHPHKTEAIFNSHGWLNSWTNGVFSYHHYHSNCHEVLGVIRGTVLLQLGGEQGQQIRLNTGDVALLPAGTGHKKLSASPDFQIVGAYPGGMEYNTRRGTAEDRQKALAEIPEVPIPDTDPVNGKAGPVHTLWRRGTLRG
ncbi:cupin domain-containing protein [Paenibacillus sp. YPG26]|uniref:cupin domain-containing protein n=1 Tax=Paenibacillus sp. YPG26 TaxID=2878915 RepID=UPI00203FC5F6|nr:cupin domain-containing protein [Paenibacillus sp. YPG26]USB33018.1 cupin domain-containing protein [Paenibacillus sp. YPG26]